jgi:deoxyribose-phosphate aldolase
MELTTESIRKYIDHTCVKADATLEDIKKLCQEAKEYGFHSVCVTAHRVSAAKALLEGADIEVISVIGFPFGISKTEIKVAEAKLAVDDGATEIDMVVNIGAIKDDDWDYVEDEIHQIAEAIKPVGLKVIMEVGFLEKDELEEACRRAESAGAAFVKSSTGYGPRPSKVEDIEVMRSSVGDEVGVKASGGIHTFEDAKAMIEAGATRIGTSSALQVIGEKIEEDKKDKAGSNE